MNRLTQLLSLPTVALCAILPLACGGSSGPAGKYTMKIDPASLAEIEKSFENMPAAMKPMIKSSMEQVKNMRGDVDLKSDNTFTMTMDTPKGKQHIEGTWKLEGDQLSMTSKIQDGKAKIETKVGTYKDGRVVMTEQGPGGQPFSMIMERS